MNKLLEDIKDDLNNGRYSFPSNVVQQLVREIDVLNNKINRIYQIWGVEPDDGDAVTNMIAAHEKSLITDLVDVGWEAQDDNDSSVPESGSV
jgi:hypothetical protein